MKGFYKRLEGRTLASILLVILWWLVAIPVARAQTTGLKNQIPASEYNALVDLYNATSGGAWVVNSGWLDPQAPSWFGVTITNGHVGVISLRDNGLSGSLSNSVGDLAQLETLELRDNGLGGVLPASIGNLSRLQYLDLTEAQLGGGIPPSLGNLSRLRFLSLQGNRLTNGIPASLGNLGQLRELALSQNQLAGSIPESFGNLTNLSLLWLFDNLLTGRIPESFGNLTNLGELFMLDNLLTGSIPDSFGNLTNLSMLWLRDNLLTGTIPPSLTNLTRLTSLYLENNRLTGEVPSFGGLKDAIVRLESNFLDVAPDSASFSNILAAAAAGNFVSYFPQGTPYQIPALGPVRQLPGGVVALGVTASAGKLCAIQASTDLVKWSPLGTILLSIGSGQFVDSSAPTNSIRFYRASVTP